MNAVKCYIHRLVKREEEVANVIYPLFTNDHEAAAVIREELEELEEAVDLTRKRYHAYWMHIRNNEVIEENDLERIKEAAVCAAVEAIQVAAMAQKGIQSMKHENREFYEKEILEIACEFKKVAVVNGEPANCSDGWSCEGCEFYDSERSCKDLLQEWLEQEHKEIRIQPEVKNLKQDARVLVSQDGIHWCYRHFYKYDKQNDKVICWNDGCTSWSIPHPNDHKTKWEYAKLPDDCSGYYSEWTLPNLGDDLYYIDKYDRDENGKRKIKKYPHGIKAITISDDGKKYATAGFHLPNIADEIGKENALLSYDDAKKKLEETEGYHIEEVTVKVRDGKE